MEAPEALALVKLPPPPGDGGGGAEIIGALATATLLAAPLNGLRGSLAMAALKVAASLVASAFLR